MLLFFGEFGENLDRSSQEREVDPDLVLQRYTTRADVGADVRELLLYSQRIDREQG